MSKLTYSELKAKLKKELLAEFQTDLSFERASFQKELNKELTAQKELMINSAIKVIENIQTQVKYLSSISDEFNLKIKNLEEQIRLLGRENANTNYNLQQLQKKFTKFVDSPRDDKLLDEMQSFVDKINEQQKEINNSRSQLKVEIARVQSLQDEIQSQKNEQDNELDQVINNIRALEIKLDLLGETKHPVVNPPQIPDLLLSKVEWEANAIYPTGLVGYISFPKENTSWIESNDSIPTLKESVIGATIYFRFELTESTSKSNILKLDPNKNGKYWTDCPIEIPDKLLTLSEVEYYLQQLKTL